MPLTDEQAKDDVAEASLVGQWHFKKTYSYRGGTNGTDHSGFDLYCLVRLIGLQDHSEKRPSLQSRCFQRATIHRNISYSVRRLHTIVGKKLRLNRSRQPLVLASIEHMRTLTRLPVERAKLIHAELAAKGKNIQLIQDALHHPALMRDTYEGGAAIGTMERFHASG